MNLLVLAIPLAFVQVAREYAIPPEVLYAVALTESRSALNGQDSMPWPWTLNVAGEPLRFATRQAAHEAAVAHLKRGERRIDLGLMQVHWAAHESRLGSLWRALDPWFNLRYGASVLRGCFQTHQSWAVGAGCYHAPRRPALAARYQARFEDALTSIAGASR